MEGKYNKIFIFNPAIFKLAKLRIEIREVFTEAYPGYTREMVCYCFYYFQDK